MPKVAVLIVVLVYTFVVGVETAVDVLPASIRTPHQKIWKGENKIKGPTYIPSRFGRGRDNDDNQQHNNKRSTQACGSTYINYGNLPTNFRPALQEAANYWTCLLQKSMEFSVQIDTADPNVLAYAYSYAFDYSGRWTVQPLYEKILNTNITAYPDCFIVINSANSNWYLGTDGNVPFSSYDLESVLLHEIGHCVGFVSGCNATSCDNGGKYYRFDTYVTYNGAYPYNTTSWSTASVSNKLYFGVNQIGKLYAPNPFTDGSSISHLDETTYLQANPNSLMTPSLANGEAIHDCGPITQNILTTMGWSIASTPTSPPTAAPTRAPTLAPTSAPTRPPTSVPTTAPTRAPTITPTSSPTAVPTRAPTTPTTAPTAAPTRAPTTVPTSAPTAVPTTSPTTAPTRAPTAAPTSSPTSSPTVAPTRTPTTVPTTPSAVPTSAPTAVPTATPTRTPTTAPTSAPTKAPTTAPTTVPTATPTTAPTTAPTAAPTKSPTAAPTTAPTKSPTAAPTIAPTKVPTAAPTKAPTTAPTKAPTTAPTKAPTTAPTKAPTKAPTTAPTKAPTTAPSPNNSPNNSANSNPNNSTNDSPNSSTN
eukprot:TRINITY_DN1390_c2_g1_i9.p1 TRINITY_DN1390_c2_g1~~TRINITY_DN1390_c2_g1_i9.p1  ORF type:complete len:589 (-),score=192.32 TRINITY_DN1390_c2_g1_i9:34-1800(-)